MLNAMTKLTKMQVWQNLQKHYNLLKDIHLIDLFKNDPNRFEGYSLDLGDLLLDYSKNHLDRKTIQLLCELAIASDLKPKIEQLFSGEYKNTTEGGVALHTALRTHVSKPIPLQGKNVLEGIQQTFNKMREISTQVRHGLRVGATGKAITDVVNIGIGGSDLGAMMSYEALKPFTSKTIRFHFISNIDGNHIEDTLRTLNPETTLFIIASKTFKTIETLMNATIAKQWLNILPHYNNQIIAVTARPEAAIEFGIDKENILPIWQWIGGRYSIWSAMGLSIAIAIGMDQFDQMRLGACEMDQHFRSAPFQKNMPILLALLGIWYGNFFGTNNHIILPYAQHLRWFPLYIQQLDMESNGKQVTRHGTDVDYQTGPMVWGWVGTNCQHTFNQHIHQSRLMSPVDFIISMNSSSQLDLRHRYLVASCLSQSQALMEGNNKSDIVKTLIQSGHSIDEAKLLANHYYLPGNKPSNTICLQTLNPKSLGKLIALYEHKVFTQGVIWDINSFDQFGVEQGKNLTQQIFSHLDNPDHQAIENASTQGIVRYFHQHHRSKLKETSD